MDAMSESLFREILDDGGVTTPQAARLIPSNGVQADPSKRGGVNPSTVNRWIRFGVKSKSGTVVKLEAAMIGGRLMTSRAALLRFFAALNPAVPTPVIPVPARSESKRRKAIDAATKRLEAAGA